MKPETSNKIELQLTDGVGPGSLQVFVHLALLSELRPQLGDLRSQGPLLVRLFLQYQKPDAKSSRIQAPVPGATIKDKTHCTNRP